MAGKYQNEQEVLSEINVVPLVDIILVVLIIFMVTAPMIMKPSIPVNLPKASSGESVQAHPLSITLAGEGQLYLNNRKIDLAGILAAAQAGVIKNPEIQAIIAADKNVPHGKVIEVLDIIKQGGVKKFGISIEKKTP